MSATLVIFICDGKTHLGTPLISPKVCILKLLNPTIMKAFKNYQSLITSILFTCFLLTVNSCQTTKERPPVLNDFQISIEKKGNEIAMQCEKGCAWINLSYQNDRDAQAINELGMTALDEDRASKDENLSEFLFTISKTTEGVSLKGMEGNAWIDLSFALSNGEKQMINQLGMMD